MSRPLIQNAAREKEADRFHRICFKTWGKRCYKCNREATDAAHVIARAHLGVKARYACPEANSRPLCRACHDAQGAGIWHFPLNVRRAAVRELNKVMKLQLREPAA